jgi:hypothetical protein
MKEEFHYGDAKYEIPKDFIKPGFYNIEYESSLDYLPVLPIHYNNKLFFLNGKNQGTF